MAQKGAHSMDIRFNREKMELQREAGARYGRPYKLYLGLDIYLKFSGQPIKG